MAADLHSLARIMWDEVRYHSLTATRFTTNHSQLHVPPPQGRHLEAVPFQEQAIRIKEQRGDEDLEEFIEDLEALKANELHREGGRKRARWPLHSLASGFRPAAAPPVLRFLHSYY